MSVQKTPPLWGDSITSGLKLHKPPSIAHISFELPYKGTAPNQEWPVERMLHRKAKTQEAIAAKN